MRISARAALATLILAASSQAAYHYVHYPNRTTFTPIYEKFNLSALPNNTVTFFVADQGGNAFGGEPFGSVLSQLKQAAAVWNSVAISDLRVAFGGVESYSDSPTVARPGNSIPAASTPGGDVIFIDTPGVVGMGAPTISTTLAQSPNGPFYPIVRGVVMISRDPTADPTPWPSYSEKFFTTAVHEMGHALGLQHTWTGGAMSSGVIKNTSHARPLDSDDVASLAELYGKSNWQANYGSISGRVTYANNGNPVSLASVVAITASGQAVSALTDPAGNYRIDGLPLNLTYSVYVHPLPPDAIAADDSGLRTPMDPNGARFNAGGPFQTTFFAGPTGTLDPRAAAQFSLIATQRAFTDVNFTVQPRASVPTYNVQVYSRLTTATRTYGNPSDADGVTISDYPGFIDSTQTTGLVIARAAAPAILPVPQSVTVLGGFATATLNNPVYPSILPYSNRPGDFIAIYFSVPQGAGTGPRHMVFNFGNDIYVLPVGVDVVRQGPPAVTAAAQNPDGTVTVAGAGLGNDSRVFFDGLQSTQGTLNPDGSLTVTPPPGATGQAAAVTVYNSDGQNSTILPGTVPPTYTYSGASGAPQIVSISPNSIPAGTSAMVDINVANMNFVDGQVTIGFGSDDVQVLRVWVVNPTHAVADVWVQAGATAGLTEVTALSGMQAATLSNAFQIQSPRAAAPAIASIVNNDSSQPNITPGAIVVINGQNLATSFGSVQLALNDTALQPAFVSTTQVAFVVPPAFPVGPATLKFTSSGALSTYTLQIDGPAPQITGVATQAGTPLAGAVATVGDVLNLTVSNLDPAVVANRQSRLRVTVGGMEMTSQQVTPAGAGVYQIQITLNQSFASSQVPLTVVADGLSSAPVGIIVR